MTNNKHFTFQASALPEQLCSQKQIVELMANYMEQNLMEVRHWRRKL
jgi:polo-like kinase 3